MKVKVQGPTPILEFGSGKPAGVPGTAVMACRAFKTQVKADKDPLVKKDGVRLRTSDLSKKRLRAEVRSLRSGLRVPW